MPTSRDVARVTDFPLMLYDDATEFNQCISSWAEETPSTVVVARKLPHLGLEYYVPYVPSGVFGMFDKTFCPNWLTDTMGTPDPDIGPWCQGVEDGCGVIEKLSPSGSPTVSPHGACVNSADFNCSEFLEGSKKPGKKCGKIIKRKGGKMVKELCPEICKVHLCTCVDSVKEFLIKGRGDKGYSCAKLRGKKKCKEKTTLGFAVKAICPNKCKNTENCIK